MRIGGTTWDPANSGAGHTLSNDNLTVTSTGASAITRTVDGHNSGKFFYVVKTIDADATIGCCTASADLDNWLSSDAFGMGALYNGQIVGGQSSVVGDSFQYGTHDLMVAIDLDNRMFWFKVLTPEEGYWNGDPTADPATNTGGVAFNASMGPGTTVYCAVTAGSSGSYVRANFGAPPGFGNL
jgi:hypothetical protein